MILSVQNVVKRYDRHLAVDRVSFDVPKGSIFGLLGPNGAGKTSLIRMITTITGPDEGIILFDGRPLDEHSPNQIGYMPEERGLYKKMKVGEHLLYLAQLKGLSSAQARREIYFWLDKFDIRNWWNKKVEELSKGMQQKIQFIATVVHRPKLLILDEPFSGLDPINTNLIKDEIRQLNADGISIIFSTHRMEQVEEMCDHIVLINRGRNVLYGEVKAIKNKFKQNLFRIETSDPLPSNFAEYFRVISQLNGATTVQLSEEESRSNALLRYLIEHNIHITRFEEILPTFNEIFIRRVEETQATA
ncbi:MAG: ABC transporter ATP-binding protein [Saprospiraceae bacterium]|nr:ABC transporter ATP-binding protein [Saprospiraceae bacterium]MDW8484069.1 ABC transporter ATP-binding protein [Saprospiraceae bacterium]